MNDKPDLNDPATFQRHIGGLTTGELLPHAQVLDRLLEQVEPVDFKALAFPQSVELSAQLKKADPEGPEAKELRKRLEAMKVTSKHYLILTVENVLALARSNQWGLCKRNDFIYVYNGCYWDETDKDAFQDFLGKAAEKMGGDKYWARYHRNRDELFRQFLALSHLPTPEADGGKVLINLKNGTFEIEKGISRLRPFDPSDFLTFQLPFDYDPKAEALIFMRYLDRVLPDPERQRVLAEFLGYVFIKNGSTNLKEEKALVLYGGGANGKSVFFEVVNALLGDFACSFSLQSLTEEKGYHRAKLANKLVNYASEINTKLEASVFKQLVSGEPVEARLPYGQPFIMRQYAKLIFNCNELPRDIEHTNAFFRRFLIIPFDVTIPEAEQDKNLHRKIIESELSGVFNWVLEGLNRLLRQGRFSECRASASTLEEYRAQSDSVKMFLDEKGYQPSPYSRKTMKEVYAEYRAFCTEDGFKPLNKTNFKRRLESAGVSVERRNVGFVAFLSEPSAPF